MSDEDYPIGIAIPCAVKHLTHLRTCLDSIADSNLLPRQVSISISSAPNNLDVALRDDYPFELRIQITSVPLGASENRNIAAKALSTRVISFMDADDLVHPQRNDCLARAFRKGATAVCHDYVAEPDGYADFLASRFEQIVLMPRYIDTLLPNVPFPISSKRHLDYHCGYISVLSEIFERMQFPEGEKYLRGQDAAYCSSVVSSGHPIDYIANALSFYRSATRKKAVLKI